MSSKSPEMHLGGRFQAITAGTHQSVAYSGTAGTITNAITSGVSIIRIVCTTAAYVKIGASPTATSSDVYVPANTPEYFQVLDTGAWKVSAIRAASDGVLHVTEGSPS